MTDNRAKEPKPAQDAMREALLKYLDIFLHPNPTVDLSGLVCKHGAAIEACPSRECSSPMTYETAIKRARDYIAAIPAAPVPSPDGAAGHKSNSVADSTGEKTGTHGASKDAGGHSRDGLTPASSPSDDVRSALADELDRLRRLEETTDDGEPDNMGESWHNYAGHFIDNHEVITAALRSAPISAPATVPPVERIEMVDYSQGYAMPAEEPTWRIDIGGVCADFATESWANNFRNAILSLLTAPAVGVTREATTKPLALLEWQETIVDRGDGSSECTGFEADSGFRSWYVIERYFGSDSYGWTVEFDQQKLGDVDDPNQAKDIAQDDFDRRIDAILALSVPDATVSEFKNELGNTIRITIEGPTSKSTNDLTSLETAKLNEALTKHFAVAVSARDAVIEGPLEYEFPYQRTFDAIVASTDILSGPPDQKMSSVSVRKFQEAFNGHCDQRPIGAVLASPVKGE